jgi:hypothetical protein
MSLHITLAAALSALALVQPWMQTFDVDTKDLVSTGESRYFVLKPGHQLTFEGRESGKAGRLVVTVLNDTMNVGGVETRVVEERESQAGELVEVSRNYFAIHAKTGDVYYFGEDVDIYRKGRVVGHEGAWRHGSNGAHFGLMMPGAPRVGLRFYQELARGIAMDRAEIVSVTDTAKTPAGVFEGCVRTKETTPLEPLAREYKMYAPGIGLIKDGDLLLVSHQYVK